MPIAFEVWPKACLPPTPVRGLSLSRSGLQTHIGTTGNRFVTRANEKLTAFVELGSAIRLEGNCVDGFVPLSKLDAVWNRGQGRKLFSRSFLLLFQMCTAKGLSVGDKLNKAKINMKLQNLIHILIAIVCIGLLPQMQQPELSRHRTGAIPASRQRKAAKLFKILPRALETQELAGVRSFQPVLPTSKHQHRWWESEELRQPFAACREAGIAPVRCRNNLRSCLHLWQKPEPERPQSEWELSFEVSCIFFFVFIIPGRCLAVHI